MNQNIENAENFLKDCLFDGLAHSWDTERNEYVKPYPEVTGYVVKYLVEWCSGKELANVHDAVKKLMEIQDKKGGYKTFYDKRYLYSFDTAQIMNGLISFYNECPDERLLKTIGRGGEFLLAMQREDGAIFPVYDTWLHSKRMPSKMYPLWNGPTSGINCKLTEVYYSFYLLTKDNRYMDAINKAKDFYLKVKPIKHTHPLGYWLEGLYRAGAEDFVEKYLKENVVNRIEPNGFISYDGELDYSYMSGEIQLAILMNKCGLIDEPLLIREFARKVQSNNESGGIIQFATRNGQVDGHIHKEVNSWGTKYYCELERMLLKYE